LSAEPTVTFQRGTTAAVDRDLGGCGDQSSAARLEYVGAQIESQRNGPHDSHVKATFSRKVKRAASEQQVSE
jgi:hypothetical protein